MALLMYSKSHSIAIISFIALVATSLYGHCPLIILRFRSDPIPREVIRGVHWLVIACVFSESLRADHIFVAQFEAKVDVDRTDSGANESHP